MDNLQMLKRWRLILGEESQKTLEGLGGLPLSEEDLLMDSALSQIYGSSGSGALYHHFVINTFEDAFFRTPFLTNGLRTGGRTIERPEPALS